MRNINRDIGMFLLTIRLIAWRLDAILPTLSGVGMALTALTFVAGILILLIH